MLICPQCQFENPDGHKFCQRCGTSLTHETCPDCSAEVPVGSLDCPSCGVALAQPLLAIVDSPRKAYGWPAPDVAAAGTPYWRYGALSDLEMSTVVPTAARLRVCDRDPYRVRSLDAAVAQAEANLARAATEDPEGEAALEASLETVVPAVARPYLALEAEFEQHLPVLVDAWEDTHQQVTILEDRTGWPGLVDLWGDPETPLPEIVYGLELLLDLWESLLPLSCASSLLDLDNLKVDEDRVPCLAYLHYSPSLEHSALLRDLGQTWVEMLGRCDRDDLEPLRTLAESLAACELLVVGEVRTHLEAISNGQPLRIVGAGSSMAFGSPRAEPQGAMSLRDAIDSLGAMDSSDLDDDDEEDTNVDDAPTVVLPMQLASLDEAGRSDIGRQRDHNEDCFGIYTNVQRRETPMGKSICARSLYILCDGMGGHASGEVASSLAVKTLQTYFDEHWTEDRLPSADAIRQGILEANRVIFETNQRDLRSGSGRMGTTLVLALVHNSKVAIAHVGDSRLYRLSRRRGLEQITVDHEVGQREIQRGVDPSAAYSRPDAYQLTQALGPRDSDFIDPDIQVLDFDEDTLLLLCSDGMSDNDLIETHWQTHLAPLLSSRANLDQGLSQLIELSNQYNGHDNISAILVRAKVQPNMNFLR